MGVWREAWWAWPPGAGESWWGLTGNETEGERREMGSVWAKGEHLIEIKSVEMRGKKKNYCEGKREGDRYREAERVGRKKR